MFLVSFPGLQASFSCTKEHREEGTVDWVESGSESNGDEDTDPVHTLYSSMYLYSHHESQSMVERSDSIANVITIIL